MTKQSIHYGIVGFLVGGTVGLAIAQFSRPQIDKPDTPAHAEDTTLHHKSGDNFDHHFLDHMITHHQGALDMANLAKHHAKHTEIKQLADTILDTQSKEIDQMRRWQKDWGYTAH